MSFASVDSGSNHNICSIVDTAVIILLFVNQPSNKEGTIVCINLSHY